MCRYDLRTSRKVFMRKIACPQSDCAQLFGVRVTINCLKLGNKTGVLSLLLDTSPSLTWSEQGSELLEKCPKIWNTLIYCK